MSEHIHDCIVVGAGPAGSAAALQMARDGLDVVFLERGNRPGEKNVMSGVLITDKLCELVPGLINAGQGRFFSNPGSFLCGEFRSASKQVKRVTAATLKAMAGKAISKKAVRQVLLGSAVIVIDVAFSIQ